ncbi:TetR/AcrR family transcriptional regulator [Schleiferilactobacillus perolens]|uniref:Regulatory protein TetR n=1 Tax=Schleiferilactobacillus perolens DSM 12744 TaxID=1423792 RepID=A0A0R1MVV1_9LACO|nr:TetR/AcrR family transcriptional regulator [Schleiferilactobacillus perolens]KRL12398.1 regulatory protein TetR [Schleiferilactobacillus perolens DSM 12744]
MPTATFNNLKPEKKQLITQALRHEFSTHSFADAQVARIVKDAGIARGAFYKYFADLADAYIYLYGVAMRDIHASINFQQTDQYSAANYLSYAEQFLASLANNPYRELIRRHFTENEGALQIPTTLNSPEKLAVLPAPDWAATILSHEVIRQIMLYPDMQKSLLAKFATTLDQLEGSHR